MKQNDDKTVTRLQYGTITPQEKGKNTTVLFGTNGKNLCERHTQLAIYSVFCAEEQMFASNRKLETANVNGKHL